MRWLYRLFHKSGTEGGLDKELRFHLEQQITDYIAAGLSPQEARRRARLEFGGLDRVKEEVRDTRWETHLDNLIRDFRYALRTLHRDRRFALMTIFAIALGIGSTTMVFSVIYNGLLRPFPYKDANRLTTFYIHDLQEVGRGDRGGFTSAEFLNLREQSQAFEEIIGFMGDDVSCTNGRVTLQLHAAYVTPNAFQFLGMDPLLGRSIGPEDAKPAAPPVFAMNYRLWQKHFNASPKIVGTSFVVGGVPRTLVAIMPSRFQIGPGVSSDRPEGSDMTYGYHQILVPVIPA